MKKYTLFLLVLLFSFGLFTININSARAYDAGCTYAGQAFSVTTGESCGPTTVGTDCHPGEAFSSITGKPCSVVSGGGNGGGGSSDNSSTLAQFNNLFKSYFYVGLKNNNDVKALQQLLKDEGYYFGRIDGSYGKISTRAVKDFQDDNDLSVTTPPVSIACTMEAKLCSDGKTTVGRVAPSCEFSACPGSATNQSPVISGVSGPQTLNVNQVGTWTVKASSASSRENLTYSVNWGDVYSTDILKGNSLIQPQSQSATFTHSYSQSGNYVPKFTVTDEKGKSAQTSLSVNVGNVDISSCPSSGYPTTPGLRCGCILVSGFSSYDGQSCGNTITPSITVLSPNGGEQLALTSTTPIRWKMIGKLYPYMSVYLQPEGSSTVYSIAGDPLRTTGSFRLPSLGADMYGFDWYVGDVDGLSNKLGKYKILVQNHSGTEGSLDAKDYSDSYFTITSASTPTCPAGGFNSTTGLPCGCASASGFNLYTGRSCGDSTIGSLAATKYSDYSDQTVVPGTIMAKLGSFTLSANSTEGVRVTTINVSLNNYVNITNLILRDNETGIQISTMSTPSENNIYSVDFTVPASSTKIINIYGNIIESANNSSIQSKVSASGVGRASGNSVSTSTILLQTITIGSGSLYVSNDATGPISGNILAGATNVPVAKFKFTAQSSSYTVKNITLYANTSGSSLASMTIKYKDINGSTQTVTSYVTGRSGLSSQAIFRNLSMYVPANSSASLDVSVNTNTIAAGATSGSQIRISLGGGTTVAMGDFVAVNNDNGIMIGQISSGSADVYSNATFTIASPTPATPIPFISVFSPNGGETWQAGSVHRVSWNNTTGKNVRIELAKGNNYITDWGSLPSLSSGYDITLSSSLQAGSDYKIRVASLDSNGATNYVYYDDSDNYFSITSAPTTPTPASSITVISPNGKENITVGSNYTVNWQTTGTVSKVYVWLCQNGYGKCYLMPRITGDGVSNTGSYTWETGIKGAYATFDLATLSKTANSFYVRITSEPRYDSNQGAYDDSDPFSVVIPPSISTTSLSNGTVGTSYSSSLQTGASGLYTWSATGLPAGLILTNNIISGTPTTAGTYTVTVTLTLNSGQTVSKQFSLVVSSVLGAEAFHFTQFLDEGTSGNEVMELQNTLSKLGYDAGKIDGFFGSKVKTAVIKFQTDKGLKVDGLVGYEVRTLLNK